MSGLIGKKIGMTRIIQENGTVTPVTVVECSPNEITQVKTIEKDGYSAIVLGFGKLKKPSKTKKFKTLKEFKINKEDEESFKIGDTITVESFSEVKKVKVTGITKGKGFQGVVKRWGFSKGPASHGSHQTREPGSVGACAKPGRVMKGKKLPGHAGTNQLTIERVKVELLDPSKNLICFKGPVPGPNGSTVIIRKN
jgi:large subunit ribosomal protein L3